MQENTILAISSFLLTIVASLIIIPILKKIKIGQIERTDGPQSHLKKQGTPTLGGVIFILAIVICTIGYYVKSKSNNPNDSYFRNGVLTLLLSIGFGIVGFIDDFKKLVLKNTKGLKPSYKMIGLFLSSVLYTIFIIRFSRYGTDIIIPIIKKQITIPIIFYIPFAILVMLGTTNAVNLTDGIDGLASSVCAIIISCLTVIAIINSVEEMVILGIIVVGSILGFLMFNLHPAKVFMGDTGSLFLGGLISAMTLYLKVPLILIIIAIIPIVETLSVMIQVSYYKKTGNRIFKMAPIHHHFELSGWNENKVVRVFSVITLIACILGIVII